ncbi:restriction endonuclease [Phenylobacterium hankyongense]|uniref:Restriction endonuclease n=1 Tax=Phenylobacterium hankyongense TaxID=1813876 RepID=A0A328AYI2_9CAUL|nr:transporter substrate-binding domain-containing protein [Phenylobacterium hankyongense]RAK60182.1 restriction endonuclease [Phenylobacterium hankyongense]
MAPSDASVAAALAPTGVLRAAINLGNVVLARSDLIEGAAGVSVDLARELGRRLGLPLELVIYRTGGEIIPGLAHDAWDVAFLAVEPERAALATFTAPYVFIDGTYLVREEAPFISVAELDAPGVRIAVAEGAAYDLALTRQLRLATLVRAPTSAAAIRQFQAHGLEAAAGIRPRLVQAAAAATGLRVLPDSFSRIEQGMALPGDRPLAARYLWDFVEAVKANGFVEDALARHAQNGVAVAPPQARRD